MSDRCLDDIDSEIKEVHGRTFRKLGSLLIEIVDRKLFQLKGFTNVEDYFNSEAHLPSARQAFRLISATRFSRQLPDTLPQPKSERQVRPLLGRPIEEAKLLWAITTLVALEQNCSVDGKLVSKVVKDFQENRLGKYVSMAEQLLHGKRVDDGYNALRPPLCDDFRDAFAVVETSVCPLSDADYDPVHNMNTRSARRTPGAAVRPTSRANYTRNCNTTRVRSSSPQPPAHHQRPSLPCAARPHSARSQVGSSENACACCSAHDSCRILSLAEQISSVVSTISQAWGCADIAQHLNGNRDGHSPGGPGQSKPPKDRPGLRNPRPRGAKVGQVNVLDGVREPEAHEGRVAEMLQRSLLQLMLVSHRMCLGPDEQSGSFPWSFWPQAWGGDSNMGPNEWQQWYNMPGGSNGEEETMDMSTFPGFHGPFMQSPMFGPTLTSLPVVGNTSNPFPMEGFPLDNDSMLPFVQDGFQFLAQSEGHVSSKAESQDVRDNDDFVTPGVGGGGGDGGGGGGDHVVGPVAGRKRDRSMDALAAGGKELHAARRGKTVRFTTPTQNTEKRWSGLAPRGGLGGNRSWKRGSGDKWDRRVDEIAVAEALICLSHVRND